MVRVLALFLSLSSSLLAADATKKEITLDGYVESYYIHTLRQNSSNNIDAYSQTVGLELVATTPSWHGLYAEAAMMSDNGIFINDDPSRVDASNLANDVAAVTGNASDKRQNIAALGEAFLGYKHQHYDLKAGRFLYDTPWANQKRVRLVPTTFSGATFTYKRDSFTLGFDYIGSIKQRTNNSFYNILEHALGVATLTNTGRSKADMMVTHMSIGEGMRLYNYHIEDFLNTSYFDYKRTISGYDFALQAIYQTSVGYFDTAIENGTALDASGSNINKSEGLKSAVFGLKVAKGFGKHKITLASTYNDYSANAYSHFIAPFDGTPLFTDTITGNNLFKSLYGKALAADAGYKAGVLALKGAYGYQITEKLKTVLSAARYDNGAAASQTDINAVIAYKLQGWTLAAKGIWVFDEDQNAGQTFQQYRLIANYPF